MVEWRICEMTNKTFFWTAGSLMLSGVACNRKASVAPPEVQVIMAALTVVPIYEEWIGTKPVCIAF